MITRSMNTEEVMKELRKDDEFLLGRMDGLGIKNNKKLKNRFVKSGDIMSESKYVVPNTKDTAVIFAMKYVDSISGKDHTTMYVDYYIKTYYGTYLMPLYTGFINRSIYAYLEFSHHSVERIMERLGKDFETFYREDYIQKSHSMFQMIDYAHNGDENESFARIGDAYAFIEKEDGGKKVIVKTIISDNELFDSQVRDKEASIVGAETALANIDVAMSKELGKSNGYFRRVA